MRESHLGLLQDIVNAELGNAGEIAVTLSAFFKETRPDIQKKYQNNPSIPTTHLESMLPDTKADEWKYFIEELLFFIRFTQNPNFMSSRAVLEPALEGEREYADFEE